MRGKGRLGAAALGVLVAVALSGLWPTAELDPLVPEVFVPELTVAPPEPEATAPPPAPDPVAQAERQTWYEERGVVLATLQRDCGVAGLDFACEGDHCAWRYTGAVGKLEYYREHLRQPARMVFAAAAWADWIDEGDTPCGMARQDALSGTVMPALRRGVPQRQPYCAVSVRPGVVRDPAVAGRICNALSVGRLGPEGAVFQWRR